MPCIKERKKSRERLVVYKAFEQETSISLKAINVINQLIYIIYFFYKFNKRGLGEVMFIYQADFKCFYYMISK